MVLAGAPTTARALRRLALAASAPLIWVALDAIVTGNPLYSLTATAGLAQELERTQGIWQRDRLDVDVLGTDRQAAR